MSELPVYQPPVSTDKSGKVEVVNPILISSHEQQDAVFGALYTSLVKDTRPEVYGMLTAEGVATNDVLRGIVKQLAISLGKDKELTPQGWLSVGITDFIPQETLQKWSSATTTEANSLFQATARYFERKNTIKR